MKPRESDKEPNSGLFVITRKENFINWCAWRFWLHREGASTFFPDTMTTYGEWPPMTQETATQVGARIKTSQQLAKMPIYFADPPQPWDRWSINETLDLERHHREDFDWLPPLPKSRIPVRTASAPNPLDAITRADVAEHKRLHPEPISRRSLSEMLKIWRIPPIEDAAQ